MNPPRADDPRYGPISTPHSEQPLTPPIQEANLSADGRWWWTGTTWTPAISEDGRWRWDGSQWIEIQAARETAIGGNRITVPGVVGGIAIGAALIGAAVSGGGFSCAEEPQIAFVGGGIAVALGVAAAVVARVTRSQAGQYINAIVGIATGIAVIAWTAAVVAPMGPNPCLSR